MYSPKTNFDLHINHSPRPFKAISIDKVQKNYSHFNEYLRSSEVYMTRSRFAETIYLVSFAFQLDDYEALEDLATLITYCNRLPYLFIKSEALDTKSSTGVDMSVGGYYMYALHEYEIEARAEQNGVIYLSLRLQNSNWRTLCKNLSFGSYIEAQDNGEYAENMTSGLNRVVSRDKRRMKDYAIFPVISPVQSNLMKDYYIPSIERMKERISQQIHFSSNNNLSQITLGAPIANPDLNYFEEQAGLLVGGTSAVKKFRILNLYGLDTNDEEQDISTKGGTTIEEVPLGTSKSKKELGHVYIGYIGAPIAISNDARTHGSAIQSITVKRVNRFASSTVSDYVDPYCQYLGRGPAEIQMSVITQNNETDGSNDEIIHNGVTDIVQRLNEFTKMMYASMPFLKGLDVLKIDSQITRLMDVEYLILDSMSDSATAVGNNMVAHQFSFIESNAQNILQQSKYTLSSQGQALNEGQLYNLLYSVNAILKSGVSATASSKYKRRSKLIDQIKEDLNLGIRNTRMPMREQIDEAYLNWTDKSITGRTPINYPYLDRHLAAYKRMMNNINSISDNVTNRARFGVRSDYSEMISAMNRAAKNLINNYDGIDGTDSVDKDAIALAITTFINSNKTHIVQSEFGSTQFFGETVPDLPIKEYLEGYFNSTTNFGGAMKWEDMSVIPFLIDASLIKYDQVLHQWNQQKEVINGIIEGAIEDQTSIAERLGQKEEDDFSDHVAESREKLVKSKNAYKKLENYISREEAKELYFSPRNNTNATVVQMSENGKISVVSTAKNKAEIANLDRSSEEAYKRDVEKRFRAELRDENFDDTVENKTNSVITDGAIPGRKQDPVVELNKDITRTHRLALELISSAEGTNSLTLPKAADYANGFMYKNIDVNSPHPITAASWYNKRTGRTEKSSASGKYQFIASSWKKYAPKSRGDGGNPVMSPYNQDAAAINYLKDIKVGGRNSDSVYKALSDLDKNPNLSEEERINRVIDILSTENIGRVWASLPASKYPQPTRGKNELKKFARTITSKNPSLGPPDLYATRNASIRGSNQLKTDGNSIVYADQKTGYKRKPISMQANIDPTPFDEDAQAILRIHNLSKGLAIGVDKLIPVYKIYVVYDNQQNTLIKNLDADADSSFYELHSARNIRIVLPTQDNPVSAAYFEVMNPLSDTNNPKNRFRTTAVNWGASSSDYANFVKYEQIKVKPGTKIHIKMGYGNDVNKLHTVFNGSVVDVGSGETMAITAEGYGRELVNEILNVGDADYFRRYLSFIDGHDKFISEVVVNTLYQSKATYHFGSDPTLNRNEINPGAIDRPTLSFNNGLWGEGSFLFFRLYSPDQRLENIYIDQIEMLDQIFHETFTRFFSLAGKESFFKEYHVWNDTLWDVLTGCRRHYPSSCLYVRELGDRSTIFLGIKEQLMIGKKSDRGLYTRLINGGDEARELTQQITADLYVPATDIHIASTSYNMIHNGLLLNANYKTAVQIPYSTSLDDFSETRITDMALLKANSEILGFDVREEQILHHSAHSELSAYRIAQAILMEESERMYSGNIILTGDASIKVGDMIYLSDHSRDMFGMIKCREVTHVFSHQDGFITIVTPGQWVEPGDMTYSTLYHKLSIYVGMVAQALRTSSADVPINSSITKTFLAAGSSKDLVTMTDILLGTGLGGATRIAITAATYGYLYTTLASAARFGAGFIASRAAQGGAISTAANLGTKIPTLGSVLALGKGVLASAASTASAVIGSSVAALSVFVVVVLVIISSVVSSLIVWYKDNAYVDRLKRLAVNRFPLVKDTVPYVSGAAGWDTDKSQWEILVKNFKATMKDAGAIYDIKSKTNSGIIQTTIAVISSLTH